MKGQLEPRDLLDIADRAMRDRSVDGFARKLIEMLCEDIKQLRTQAALQTNAVPELMRECRLGAFEAARRGDGPGAKAFVEALKLLGDQP